MCGALLSPACRPSGANPVCDAFLSPACRPSGANPVCGALLSPACRHSGANPVCDAFLSSACRHTPPVVWQTATTEPVPPSGTGGARRPLPAQAALQRPLWAGHRPRSALHGPGGGAASPGAPLALHLPRGKPLPVMDKPLGGRVRGYVATLVFHPSGQQIHVTEK